MTTELVISTLRGQLDHHNFLEVLVLRGGRARQSAEGIIATKGVQPGQLTMTAAC